LTQKDQCIEEKNLDYENIHEGTVSFGTEQLRLLLEKTEEKNIAGQGKTDNPEITHALRNEIHKVINALSK
jgi:hypothetical protein